MLDDQVIKLKKDNNKLSDENLNLKLAMSEQFMSEKVNLVRNSKNKVDMYFNEEKKNNVNRLRNLEDISKTKILETNNLIDKELTDSVSILKEIDDFKLIINDKLNYLRNRAKNATEIISQEIDSDYETLEKEPISDKVIIKRARQNSFETKIGLNLISKIGAFLMLLGVLTLFKYTYTSWFNDYIKASVGFLMGFIFLAGGEWFNKKENSVFSVSLVSIGIGILYISIFNTYFALEIISITTALMLSILITLISVLLSIKYDSKTITIVSLIGGYLPLFSYNVYFGFDGPVIYIAMMYLLMLNMSVLFIGMKKRWMSVQYMSFLLNLPTSIFLAFGTNINYKISLVYILTVFTLYIGIVISNPIINKIKLRKSEVLLLGLNVVVNSIAVYSLFYLLKWTKYDGLLALFYALVYFILGNYIKAKGDKKSADLLYLTALTFSALMIPLQFGVRWINIGWLIEAVLLLYIVNRKYKDDKILSLAGWVILGLSTLSFLMFRIDDTGISYIINYTVLTLSLIYIVYLNKDNINNTINGKKTGVTKLLSIYQYFVMFFVWGYVTRMTYYPFENIKTLYAYSGLFDCLLITGSTIILGNIYSSDYLFKKDKISKIISSFMFLVAIGITINSTMSYQVVDGTSQLLVNLVFIAYNVIAFMGAKRLLNIISNSGRINLETYFLLLAIYIFGSSSILIYGRFDNYYVGLIINIVYIILSFAYILYGFKERKIMIRKFGLGLTFFALVKLFMFEFNYVDTLGKIIAYFVFGIILMAISYMYQRLEKSIKEDD